MRKYLKIFYALLLVFSIIYFLLYVLVKHFLAIEPGEVWGVLASITGVIMILRVLSNREIIEILLPKKIKGKEKLEENQSNE